MQQVQLKGLHFKKRANSCVPAVRGDKWKQQLVIRCSSRGYQPRSVDRIQQGVRYTSPPYLDTLLHPTPLSLRTGAVPNEDVGTDG